MPLLILKGRYGVLLAKHDKDKEAASVLNISTCVSNYSLSGLHPPPARAEEADQECCTHQHHHTPQPGPTSLCRGGRVQTCSRAGKV